MVKNVNQCFPKPNTMTSNVLFSPQPKDIPFILIRKFSCKLEEEKCHFYLLLLEPVNQI